MSRGALQTMLRRSRYGKQTEQIFCTRSEKWSENRSSRFKPKILLILFWRGSGPPSRVDSLNTCGDRRPRLRRGSITVASCPSTEQLLAAEQLLAERLRAEQLFDAEHLSHRQLARTVVTTLESLLLRLAEKSSHVHITERVLYTEVQRKGSVAYHRDPAAIRFDLTQMRTVKDVVAHN